jgi:hypothetical protein
LLNKSIKEIYRNLPKTRQIAKFKIQPKIHANKLLENVSLNQLKKKTSLASIPKSHTSKDLKYQSSKKGKRNISTIP